MSFQVHRADSVEQAIDLVRTLGSNTFFLAGGTDLIIQTSRGRKAPHHVIDISRIPSLAGIHCDKNALSIGTITTHKEIERHPFIRQRLTALAEAARVVGGHQVRNIATVGGNIANASPAADVAVALLALGATVELTSIDTTRSLSLDAFFLGPGKTARTEGELVRGVDIPLEENSASAFLKAGRRKAMEISVVCVAASLIIDPPSRTCLAARVALGAVAPIPMRARAAEAHLIGRNLTPDVLRRAGEIAADESSPLDDVRASAAYRRILVSALVPRALERCRMRVVKAAP